jgi:hypothetical protein
MNDPPRLVDIAATLRMFGSNSALHGLIGGSSFSGQ